MATRTDADARSSHSKRGVSQLDIPLELSSGSSLSLYGGDHAFLRAKAPAPNRSTRSASVVDLFAGCGGLTLGVQEACRELDYGLEIRAAVESDIDAAACFRDNFHTTPSLVGVESIFAQTVNAAETEPERELKKRAQDLTFLIGGPPCQGHSDLNNYSRRDDPKNHLYLYMARAAQILQPAHVLIENVPTSIHDRSRSVQRTQEALKTLGYNTSIEIVSLEDLGMPQKRKRLVMLATRQQTTITDLLAPLRSRPKTVRWAIEDLAGEQSGNLVDDVAASAPVTKKRIDYLFDHDVYDLPDTERPACHRDKRHSYKSIYGRLQWDKPAQTITRGFYSMCMGRFVHPSVRRTLTAHEAARLQFFPDFFSFRGAKSRNALAKIIGNAVPMKLSYLISRELLRRA